MTFGPLDAVALPLAIGFVIALWKRGKERRRSAVTRTTP